MVIPQDVDDIVTTVDLCRGLPLHDYGFLDSAKGLLLDTLHTLPPLLEKGVPIVGLEPSCVAVFRDELRNLFPHLLATRLYRPLTDSDTRCLATK